MRAILLTLLGGLLARAETPLAKPLADFDKLVTQLKTSSVIGEPIRTGDTAVVPFARIQFSLSAGELMTGFAGGLGGKTIPLGILIVEGDDVRAELFPEQQEKTAPIQDILQAILDKKVVFMVNGLNIGNAPGSVKDLAPLVSALTGQTTMMVQALNLGNLKAPPSTENVSLDSLNKRFEARDYVSALAVADALIAKDGKNADVHAWKGRVMSSLAQTNPADMLKYGAAAREEFEKALKLDPKNRTALLGRGIGRLMAPAGYGGDIDGAIADFEKTGAYFYLGEALKNKGWKDKAAAAYKKALAQKPNDPDVLKALAAVK